MAEALPTEFLDLFTKPTYGLLATLMPDGQPQVTPVWCDREGDVVLVNSSKGRQKDRNMRRDPRVTICLMDPDRPYRYLEVRGRVEEITEEGADAHIDKLAKRYLNKDKYPFRQPGEVRVLYKITPERITKVAMG